MAFTVHFERDETAASVLLDHVEVSKSHTGENPAEAFVTVLQDFGIKYKVSPFCKSRELDCTYRMRQILAVTADNASNNDTVLAALAAKVPWFEGKRAQGRCFAHTINLIVKSILKEFEPKKKHNSAPEKETEEIYCDNEQDGMTGWVDEWAEMTETERKELDASVQPLAGMLGKVSKSHYKGKVMHTHET